jgi:transcriptional regulator with XRE-family HTH domain
MDELTAFGWRVRELRCWRRLTLREVAGLAGLSFSFWGQVERGEKAVTRRPTLEAMADALRVHPVELTEQPWVPREPIDTEAKAELVGISTALERYELGVDPEVPVRAWPQIQADLDRLVYLHYHTVDYAAAAGLAPRLIGELQAAYVRLPQQRREVLLGLIDAHRVAMRITKDLGDCGLPMVAVRAVQQCAEEMDDAVWLGCAAVVRGWATGELDRAGQYRRSVAAAEILAARMDTEVGTWARLWFGPAAVGIHRTSLALELGEYGQALEAAKVVRPELLPKRPQAFFWIEFGRALVAERKTRDKGVQVLLHAEQLAPDRLRTDSIVRETVTGLQRQVRGDAGGRELRRLAWRLGIAPMG